jgi:hypothetical protein
MDAQEVLNQMLTKHFEISCIRTANDKETKGIKVDDCIDVTDNRSHSWSLTG